MFRRQNVNIPIEVIRTAVAIAETGSLSKAGERLGLSQPAISSQVKRLQSLVGGSLFVRTANGTTTTELGKLALQQARRILEANDQLLRLGGNNLGPRPVRLGLSAVLLDEFLEHQAAKDLADVFIYTDHSTAIGRGLVDGYVDVACMFENERLEPDVEHTVVNEYEEAVVWVRSRDFVLSPGAPIPILAFPGDDRMIPTLTKHGLAYKIVFNSPDFHARMRAVKAGLGLTSAPRRVVPGDLVITNDYYLPPLPRVKSLLCVRLGLEGDQAIPLLRRLSELFFQQLQSVRPG